MLKVMIPDGLHAGSSRENVTPPVVLFSACVEWTSTYELLNAHFGAGYAGAKSASAKTAPDMIVCSAALNGLKIVKRIMPVYDFG